MAVSKNAKELFNSFFEKPEVFAANLISNFLERRNLLKFRNKDFKLTKEQKKESEISGNLIVESLHRGLHITAPQMVYSILVTSPMTCIIQLLTNISIVAN